MKKLLTAVLALVLSAGFAAAAFAQAKPKVLVEQREAAMTLMGKYLGPLAAMAKGKAAYNAETVQRNAAYLDVLSEMPWDGFAPSTKGVKSRALPAVYEDTEKFKKASQHLQDEIDKLVTASKGGDEAAVKSQVLAVAKSCGGCHDDFRQKRR